MRTERVVTHRTCTQNCVYCLERRASDEPAFVRTRAVLGRVDAALRGASATAPRRLVLTGGEPTMRSDLAALVAHAARPDGSVQVVLETHAGGIDRPTAEALRRAGLSAARVNLSGHDPALDAVTRDPGGFVRTCEGVEALVAAGVAVEFGFVLVRETAAFLEAQPAFLVARFGPGPDTGWPLWVQVPAETPDPASVLPWVACVPLLERTVRAARRAGVSVSLDPDCGPPPCAFPSPASVASLYAMGPGGRDVPGFQHLPVCDHCAVSDRCPGVPSRAWLRESGTPLTPLRDERLKRRLSVITTRQDQIRRELVRPSLHRSPGLEAPVPESLVRIHFHCNQACRFCFVPTHLPPASRAAVRDAIVHAARAGHRVVLTGGEPTLDPELPAWVELARREGAAAVVVQTNAVRLGDPRQVRALVAAGMQSVQVSLHASQAELSDAITEAPGTFEKTCAGIDALHAEPELELVLNFVVTSRNAADLPAVTRMVADRWPRTRFSISFVAASSDLVPRDPDLVPRYADVLPFLTEAMDVAVSRGLRLENFQSMCGVPLCLVPERHRPALTDIPEGVGEGEFTYAPACDGCSLRNRCYGLRKGYIALHGADEVSAVRA